VRGLLLTIVLTPLLIAAQASLPPLFLREGWRQRERPPDAAADFVPEGGVTAAALTNADLELHLYDPNAKSVPGLPEAAADGLDRPGLGRTQLHSAGRL
jgi:hypothetical protein